MTLMYMYGRYARGLEVVISECYVVKCLKILGWCLTHVDTLFVVCWSGMPPVVGVLVVCCLLMLCSLLVELWGVSECDLVGWNADICRSVSLCRCLYNGGWFVCSAAVSWVPRIVCGIWYTWLGIYFWFADEWVSYAIAVACMGGLKGRLTSQVCGTLSAEWVMAGCDACSFWF